MIKLICIDQKNISINQILTINTKKLIQKNIKIGILLDRNSKKLCIRHEYEGSCCYSDVDLNKLMLEKIDIDLIDYNNNKLTIINKWQKTYNINNDEIAYITRIEDDTKYLFNNYYIFLDKDINTIINEILQKGNIIQEIKNEVNYQLDYFNNEEILNLCYLFKNFNNNIYITGIGKSENVAKHLTSLLKSIGLKCFDLNCQNSLHGDIGSVKDNDYLILFSNSGNTYELINLVKYIKCKKIGIFCKKNSELQDLCYKTIILPFTNEIQNTNLKNIPTNSIMSQILFCNILIINLINYLNINEDKYKLFHPAGNIGYKYLQLKDILITKYPKIILVNNISINNILLEMTKYNTGCCFFVNNNNKLLGLITDGDIRRLLIQTTKSININNINKNYYYETNLLLYYDNIINKKHYKYIPILNDNINKVIIGIIKL